MTANNSKMINKKRLILFGNSDKIQLIQEVEKNRLLWDPSDKKHYDAVYIKSAWENIAEVLNRSVSDCKTAWKSLRDSYRYHRSVATRKRQSTAGGAGSEQTKVSDGVEWHLAPYMAYLAKVSSQKRTSESTPVDESASTSQDPSIEPDLDCSIPESNSSQCSNNDIDEVPIDGDASTSSDASSESFPNKKRNLQLATNSGDVLDMLENFISEQKEKFERTEPIPLRPVIQYWDGILNEIQPKYAKEAERAVTQLLWNYQKMANP
ncbi:uncharacterized protein LOC117783433 isoform X2 [Drosophila innubila]|uniref:uncharacterized protein LOC117783433 isoform X2 n=1 Tax=Drosophila innubila TaxID=198719 RepID=UPI00148C3B68|nr:uncharacterized protein LOC117783433 isoform X2 [Drosophila innubila]